LTVHPTRVEAAAEARRLLQASPLYLDTETTGTGPTAEIVEIGVIDQDGVTLFDSLVRPRGRVEPDAARVHGITAEQLATAPGWESVWPQVRAVLVGRRVGVYNVDFDLRLMKQSHTAPGYAVTWMRRLSFCIMKLYARFHGEWDRKRGAYRWSRSTRLASSAALRCPTLTARLMMLC
jgi:DNA polymerase III epsilon subunit-like protein